MYSIQQSLRIRNILYYGSFPIIVYPELSYNSEARKGFNEIHYIHTALAHTCTCIFIIQCIHLPI